MTGTILDRNRKRLVRQWLKRPRTPLSPRLLTPTGLSALPSPSPTCHLSSPETTPPFRAAPWPRKWTSTSLWSSAKALMRPARLLLLWQCQTLRLPTMPRLSKMACRHVVFAQERRNQQQHQVPQPLRRRLDLAALLLPGARHRERIAEPPRRRRLLGGALPLQPPKPNKSSSLLPRLPLEQTPTNNWGIDCHQKSTLWRK